MLQLNAPFVFIVTMNVSIYISFLRTVYTEICVIWLILIMAHINIDCFTKLIDTERKNL